MKAKYGVRGFSVVWSDDNKILVFKGDALWRDACSSWDSDTRARKAWDAACDRVDKEAER
jgi:hypothetical protein